MTPDLLRDPAAIERAAEARPPLRETDILAPAIRRFRELTGLASMSDAAVRRMIVAAHAAMEEGYW